MNILGFSDEKAARKGSLFFWFILSHKSRERRPNKFTIT